MSAIQGVILKPEDYERLQSEAELYKAAEENSQRLIGEIKELHQQINTKPVVRIDDPNEPWGDTGRTYNAKSHNVYWGRHGLWINDGSEFRSWLGEGATLDPQ